MNVTIFVPSNRFLGEVKIILAVGFCFSFLCFHFGCTPKLSDISCSFRLKITHPNMFSCLFNKRPLVWTSLKPLPHLCQETLFLILGGQRHHILPIPWSAECKPNTKETLGETETKAATKQHNLQNHVQSLAFSTQRRSGLRDSGQAKLKT